MSLDGFISERKSSILFARLTNCLIEAMRGHASISIWIQPTKVDFRLHEPEALADFCVWKEIG
jgi:hypothetical protein